MNGLLYKNIIQSKFFLLGTALLPPVMISFFTVFSMDLEKGFSMETLRDSFSQYASSGLILRFSLYFICFFITIVIQNSIISIDEIKKWAYFIAASPNGAKKHIYSKYLIIFMMLGICLISVDLTDMAHCALTAVMVNETMPFLSSIFTFTFYIILLYFAVDIPFSIRFGVKKGAQIKCMILVTALLCVVIYLLFGPLPDSADMIFDAVYGTVEKIIMGQLSEEIMVVMGIVPIISAAAYVLSYFISCKLFVKGVEKYDK